jgi:hypothetical protein
MPVPYLTMADIVTLYGIPPRTAKRRAAQDKWRRTSSKPRRYSAADVEASLGRPRPRSPRVRRHLTKHYSPACAPLDKRGTI